MPKSANGKADPRDGFTAMAVRSSVQSASAAASSPAFSASTLVKSLLLLLLVFQNSGQTLVIRYSRGILHEPYSTLSTVLSSEAVKLLICVLVIGRTQSYSPTKCLGRLTECLTSSLPMSVPAVLYLCQNKLNYVALTYLSSAAHSMISQLKLLSTAIFAVLILRKVLYGYQWRALMLLFTGVILVQSQPSAPTATTTNTAAGAEVSADWGVWLLQYVGVGAAVGQASLSGLAGVYTEWQLKKGANDFTLWERNFQLTMYSILFGLPAIYMSSADYAIIVQQHSFFYGYSVWTWACVALQSGGGLLIAAVMAYTDNILKNMATSIAILVTSAVSFFLFHDVSISVPFVCGTTNIIIAVFIYNENIKELAQHMGLLPATGQHQPIDNAKADTAILVEPELDSDIVDK